MRTKAHIVLLLLAAAVACRKGPVGDGACIVFTQPRLPQTKVLYNQELSSPYPTGENFTVYVQMSASSWANEASAPADLASVMTGEECAYNGSTWSPTSKDYYWSDVSAKPYLTAQAYSPTGAAARATITQGMTTGFTFTNFYLPHAVVETVDVADMSAEANWHFDLLYSDRSYNVQKKSSSGSIPLRFRHALASVIFKVGIQSDPATMPIHLDWMRLDNVYCKGTFTQGLTGTRNDTTEPQSGSWSALTEEARFINFIQPGDAHMVTPSEDTGPWINSDKALLMIPQPMDHTATTGHQVMLTTQVTVHQESGEDITGSVSLPLEMAGSDHWLAGNRYVYKILLYPHSISATVKLESWTDQTIDL